MSAVLFICDTYTVTEFEIDIERESLRESLRREFESYGK
jgi:hypothetical protein